MVEIIPESNPDLNKNEFLKVLYENYEDGIPLKVTRVSECIPSSRNKDEDYIYIDFLISGECKGLITMNDGITDETTIFDASDDIIAIPFTIGEPDENKNYPINRKKNIFNILNYGMKKQGMIPANNTSSLKATYDEIKTAIEELEFIGTARLVKSKEFNNYLRLEVKEKGVNIGN